MTTPANSSNRVLKPLTLNISTTANGDLTNTELPDTILVTAIAAGTTIALPKIGTQLAPVGSEVSIVRTDTGNAFAVTVAPDARDAINGTVNGSISTAFPVNVRNNATFRAVSITAGLPSNTRGDWQLVQSSVPNI